MSRKSGHEDLTGAVREVGKRIIDALQAPEGPVDSTVALAALADVLASMTCYLADNRASAVSALEAHVDLMLGLVLERFNVDGTHKSRPERMDDGDSVLPVQKES